MSNEIDKGKVVHQRINQRKKIKNLENESNLENSNKNNIDPLNMYEYPTGITMNLMEEVLLCGMKDDEVI